MKQILISFLFIGFLSRCTNAQNREEIKACAREQSDKLNYSGAIEEFTKLIKLNSKDTNSYFDRATLYYEVKDYQSAIKDFTSGTKLDKNNPDNYFYIGRSYYHLKKYKKAISNLTIAIGFEEDNSDMHYYKGLALEGQKKYNNALIEYEKAVQLNTLEKSYYESINRINKMLKK